MLQSIGGEERVLEHGRAGAPEVDEERVLLETVHLVVACDAVRIDDDADHLGVRVREDLLEQQPQPAALLLVDGHDEHGVARVEQLLGQLEAALHHREPLGVLVGVVPVYVVVVVLPVVVTRVVRRVDVDAVHLAGVGECEHLERMVVLAVDDDLVGPVAAPLHAAGLPEPRVDGLVVLRHGDEVPHGDLARPLLVSVVDSALIGIESCHLVRDRGDLPQEGRAVVFRLSAFGEDLHDVAADYFLAVEAHALWAVVLEHEPVLALAGVCADVGGELGVAELERAVNKILCGVMGGGRHHSPP